MRAIRPSLLCGLFVLLVATPARAQIQQPAGPPPTPRHTGIKATLKGIVIDLAHVPSLTNLMLAGIGGGVALAAHPFDDNVNQALAGSGAIHAFFTPGKHLGQTYTLAGVSLTVYAIGRTRDQPRVSHIGMDLLRSVVLSQELTIGLKYATRRERPDGSNNRSFPSGHASTTFAVATVLERHFGWRAWIPAYTFATYVAASRLHENRHHLSDVAFGAALGLIAGRTVTRHGRAKFEFTMLPVPRGVAFGVVRRCCSGTTASPRSPTPPGSRPPL